MAITYTEFDTTPAGLIAAVKAAILTNAHWAELPVDEYTTTTTGATSSSGNTVTVSNPAGFVVGGAVLIGTGAAEAARVITAVAGSTITISTTWGSIFASGTAIKTRDTVLKSTATNGAQLIVNLEGESTAVNYLGVSVHSSWTGTAPGGFADRTPMYVYYRSSASGATTAMPLHVTVSAGQDHLFVAVEGPRSFEAAASSTVNGSAKNYFALSTLVNYHAADTVAPVIAIGQSLIGTNIGVSTNSHQVSISKESTGAAAWTAGRLATLTFPTIYSTDVVSVNRSCSIDGKNYILPYVLFSETEGIRGRLTRFFFANTNSPSPATDYADPVGTRVSQDGIVYRLVAVNKGDGTQSAWGPFGSISNGNTPSRTVIVAVPYAVA